MFVLLNNNCLLHMPVSNQTTSKVCRGLYHEIFYDSVVVDVSFLVTEVFDDILLTFRVKINPAVNKSRIEHRERANLGVLSV